MSRLLRFPSCACMCGGGGNMCMCLCMFVCMCVWVFVSMGVCLFVCVHVCSVCVGEMVECVSVCYACMCVYEGMVFMLVCICMWGMCVFACGYVHVTKNACRCQRNLAPDTLQLESHTLSVSRLQWFWEQHSGPEEPSGFLIHFSSHWRHIWKMMQMHAFKHIFSGAIVPERGENNELQCHLALLFVLLCFYSSI